MAISVSYHFFFTKIYILFDVTKRFVTFRFVTDELHLLKYSKLPDTFGETAAVMQSCKILITTKLFIFSPVIVSFIQRNWLWIECHPAGSKFSQFINFYWFILLGINIIYHYIFELYGLLLQRISRYAIKVIRRFHKGKCMFVSCFFVWIIECFTFKISELKCAAGGRAKPSELF